MKGEFQACGYDSTREVDEGQRPKRTESDKNERQCEEF